MGITAEDAVEKYRAAKEAEFSRQHAASTRFRFRRFLAAFPGAKLVDIRPTRSGTLVGAFSPSDSPGRVHGQTAP